MQQQFGSLTASELYCPKCRKSQPVRERLLLLLPTGELFEYRCVVCGTSLGERTVTQDRHIDLSQQLPPSPKLLK